MKRLIAVIGALAFVLVVGGAANAADHAAVGADKCAKMCHKIQYDSWLKSKHATNDPKVECETCHGNGADYMKMSVMKDPVKAKEMGLIAQPEKTTCTAKCHKPAEFKDDMLTKVHAHKPKPAA